MKSPALRALSLTVVFTAAIATDLAAQQGGRPLLNPPRMDGSAGATVFSASCAECHTGEQSGRAPGLTGLGAMTPRAIVTALESGRMRRHGEQLSSEERVAVAEWLTAKTLTETRIPASAFCSTQPVGPGPVHWSGWGGGDGESGYQGAHEGVTAADLPNLELAWVFAFPDAGQVRSKPAVVGDRLIVGSAYGEVYSLDLETGCAHWVFPADAAVRGAIAIASGPDGRQTAFFSDFGTNVYALDAASGELLWKQKTGTHGDNTNTGSVVVHDGRVFVPISSMEILSAGNPRYECCTSSGGVVALSAESGEELWAYRTIEEAAVEVGANELGTKIFAPSGAPVWSSPTVDAERGVLYIGTGENYTSPATTTSDALIAIEMATGTVAWSFQATEADTWNMACTLPNGFENCPTATGPDFDFGMAPILTIRENGERILVAGQKSGLVWGLDPDANGELVWAKRVGKGGALGGVHWGLATDGKRVYVPNADNTLGLIRNPRTGEYAQENGEDPATPGVYAIELGAGEVIWSVEPETDTCEGRQGCMPFFSAAPTAIEGAVLVGSLDGHMRAYSTEDGSLLWDVDTAREFETVNGVPGRGGSIDGPGPVVAQGFILVNSGYDMFGEAPGNLLLAFRVPN